MYPPILPGLVDAANLHELLAALFTGIDRVIGMLFLVFSKLFFHTLWRYFPVSRTFSFPISDLFKQSLPVRGLLI